jgi:hypothetical protein
VSPLGLVVVVPILEAKSGLSHWLVQYWLAVPVVFPLKLKVCVLRHILLGLLWLSVPLVLAVTPADDGVLPIHLKLLLLPERDGDDGLLPLVVSVSVLLLPIPRVDDAVDGLPLAEDPLFGGHARPLGPDAGGGAR